jgi:hypothetical protein
MAMDGDHRSGGGTGRATPAEVLARTFGGGARVTPSDPATTPAWLRADSAWDRADAAARARWADAGGRSAQATDAATLPGADGAR